MNKILKLSAIALLASSVSAMAQKTGASIAVFGAIAGAEVDASGNESSGVSGAQAGSGSVGKVTPIGGFDIGYNFTPYFAVGATYIPVEAKIGTGRVDGGSVTGELKDHYTIYVEPAFVINKDASLYGRLQYAHADMTLTGATGSNKLEGWGVGVGLKTFLNANTFVRAEANYTEYDKISGTNVSTAGTTGGGSTTTTVSGTPYLAQGIISIGYQF
jgi:opacity protein-like surface antigen